MHSKGLQYNATIREKDKGFQVIVSYKDGMKWKQKSKQGFKTKKDAKMYIDVIVNDLKETLSNYSYTSEELKNITLNDFKDLMLENKKAYLQGNTIIQYNKIVKSIGEIKDYKIKDITSLDIQKMINTKVNEGKAKGTITSTIVILKAIFRSASNDYGIVHKNPMQNLTIPKTFPKVSKKALTTEQINNLLKSLENNKQFYIMALLGITTGLRIGEILGLKYEDINLEEKELSVKRQCKLSANSKMLLSDTLKTENSYRIVPIPESTINEILLYKCNNDIENGFLFNIGDARNIYMRFWKEINKMNISPHELRHTYITKLVQSGIDFKTVAYLAGHTVEMTMKIYSHVNNDSINNARNKILEKNMFF